MKRLTLFFHFVCLLILTEISMTEERRFPLKNCHSGRFDILEMRSQKKTPSNDRVEVDRFDEIVCFWSNDGDECNAMIDGDGEERRIVVYTVVDKTSNNGSQCNRLFMKKGQSGADICNTLSILSSLNLSSSNAIKDIELNIKIAKEIFSDMNISRQNSTPVAIVSVNTYDFPTVYKDIVHISEMLKREDSEINILVSIYGPEFEVNTQYLGAVIVAGSRLNYKKAQMMVCKDCLPGWFPVEYGDLISCHQLRIYPEYLNWISASYSCSEEDKDFHISGVESVEELAALREQLFLQILENKNNFQLPNNFVNNSIGVLIGLRRNTETVAKRFQWENPLGSRPLVINHWLPGQPAGGFSHGCVFWFYSNILNYSAPLDPSSGENRTGSSLFSEFITNNTEGWMSIGCGVRMSNLFLCEMPQYRFYTEIFQTTHANNDSYMKPQKRSDFLEFEGNIVSTTANSYNDTFQKYMTDNNKGFPMFDCEEDSATPRYIPYSYVCDSIDHCTNRRDETACYPPYCDHCDSGECIPLNSFCDIVEDCADRSDEKSCPCNGSPCCDGTCLPPHLFNDGEIDCYMCEAYFGQADNDESTVPRQIAVKQERCAFICNSFQCVFPSQINGSEVFCNSAEGHLDETLGKLERANSCSDKLGRPIWAPKCVYVRDRYGAVLGCRDLSHLQNCSDFHCQEGYSKCPGSYCIPMHYVLDGKSDCPRGEEEGPEVKNNCTGNFACWNSPICLHPDLVCDGHPDCPNKDDELNCDVACSKGLRCVAGTVTAENDSLAVSGSAAFLSKTLRYIDLSRMNLSQKYVAGACQEISYLLCSRCSITSIDTFLSKMSRCTFSNIDVSYNSITTVNQLCAVRSRQKYVRALNLSFNGHLATFVDNECAFLEILDLSHTGFSVLESNNFEGLINLRHLNLSHTKLISLKKQSFLQSFTLQTLDLRGAPIVRFSEDTFNGLIITTSLDADNFGLCCPQIRGSGILGDMCHVTEDAISSCNDLIGLEVQRILFWVMAGAALFGNLLVILFRLIWDRAVLKLAYGLFVLNLGISDLIMGLYLLMIAVADVYYRGVYVLYDQDWRESVVCKIAGFLATFSSESTTFFVFLITLDRFLVLRFPYGQVRFSKTTKLIAVVLSWCVGFMLAVILVLPVFDNESVFTTSAVCVNLPMTTQRVNGWGYSFGVFIVLNFIMFLFTALGQIGIFRSMSANRMSKEATNQNTARRAQDITVAKQLSLVVLSNFLCWFPIGLMGFLSLSGHQISNDVYAWTVVLVLPVNAAINPLLYTIPVLMAKWEKFKYKK